MEGLGWFNRSISGSKALRIFVQLLLTLSTEE